MSFSMEVSRRIVWAKFRRLQATLLVIDLIGNNDQKTLKAFQDASKNQHVETIIKKKRKKQGKNNTSPPNPKKEQQFEFAWNPTTATLHLLRSLRSSVCRKGFGQG